MVGLKLDLLGLPVMAHFIKVKSRCGHSEDFVVWGFVVVCLLNYP